MEVAEPLELEADTLRYRIVRLLKEFPKARSSDKYLLEKYYELFEHRQTLLSEVDANPSSIIRHRRLIQRANVLLKGEPTVEAAREAHSKEFRRMFSESAANEGHISD